MSLPLIAPTTLRAGHTRFDPVFVLGHPRSGTTLTCQLLLAHLDVNFGTESQFIIRYRERLHRYGDLNDDRRLRFLFEEISGERFFERTRSNFGFVFDVDRAMRTIDRRTYAGVLQTVFEQFAQSKGRNRWGDKTPAYSRHLPVLHELFPTAQYIHVVRDGRDVAVSAFKTGFGPKNAFEAAVAWSEQVRTIERFGTGLSAGNFLTVRYEDLLCDPAAAMGTIAKFLGIRNTEEVLAASAGPIRAQVWENNSGKCREFLSVREIECFEALAADVLDRFGYQLRYRRRTKPITAAETIYWKTKGVWKRVANPQYWADNRYKAQLRLRAATLALRRSYRSAGPVFTRFFPARFAAYNAASARSINSRTLPSGPDSATPMLTVTRNAERVRSVEW